MYEYYKYLYEFLLRLRKAFPQQLCEGSPCAIPAPLEQIQAGVTSTRGGAGAGAGIGMTGAGSEVQCLTSSPFEIASVMLLCSACFMRSGSARLRH